MGEEKKTQIISRFFITADGDVVVSDLWEEIYQNLVEEVEGELVFKD